MGKLGLAGSSLAAALPGAGLFYLLLMGFLGGVNGMPMPMQVAIGLLMLISLVMVLFPLYILIMFRRDKVVLAKPKGAAPAVAAAGTAEDEVFTEDLDAGVVEESWDSPEDSFEADDGLLEAEAVDADDLGETLDFNDPESGVTNEDVFQTEEIDEFGQTMMQDINEGAAREEFDAPPTFDDEFSFDDFEDDDKDPNKTRQ